MHWNSAQLRGGQPNERFKWQFWSRGGREAGEGGKERVGNLDNLGTVVFLKGKSSGIT